MEVDKPVKTKKRVRLLSKPEVIIERDDIIRMTEMAQSVSEEVILAAVQTVEDIEHPVKNIRWITHGEFTVEGGRLHIEKFISTWEFEDQWVHYTEFIERKDLHHTFLYNYCVRWSVPTARRPIPHIFAGVDFTIKFSKGKPPDAPVEVFYIFEDHKLVHRPGTYRFREQWLRDIIECKHSLLASIPV